MDERMRALEQFDLVHGLGHQKEPSLSSISAIVLKVVFVLLVLALFIGAIVFALALNT